MVNLQLKGEEKPSGFQGFSQLVQRVLDICQFVFDDFVEFTKRVFTFIPPSEKLFPAAFTGKEQTQTAQSQYCDGQ
jgi:hypothetical protein